MRHSFEYMEAVHREAEQQDGFQQQLDAERLARIEYDFGDWWNSVGSGIIPYSGDDMEEHAKRVARETWFAAINKGTA